MRKKTNPINSFFYYLFNGLIKFYQNLISPIIPARCRYYPTCSEYGRQALAWHGPWRGGALTLKRLGRCHPLGGHGIDFVPLPLYRFEFHPLTKPSSSAQSLPSPKWVYLDQRYYPTQLNLWLKQPPALQDLLSERRA